MALRIWFNRWFSTVSHYMELIRHNPDNQEFIIHGTHPNPETVYFKYCDVSGTEPNISGEAYLTYCLDYCVQHQIDVFVPRKENALIAQNLHKFEQIGVKVLVCPDGDLMELMDNKAAMYESLLENERNGQFVVQIPAYKIVNNAEDFKKAYEELSKNNTKLCIKPVVGEGAMGFRIIDDSAESLSFLFKSASSQKLSFETIFRILETEPVFPEMMVLEYLDDYEYSIDCLAQADGTLLTAIPRKKAHGRIREIEYNEELIQIAHKMAELYKIPFVFNIQVKYKNGIPKLLEINPRMSGGLHISCLSGVNIPYYAIKTLLGGKVEELHPTFGIKATHIEQSIILS